MDTFSNAGEGFTTLLPLIKDVQSEMECIHELWVCFQGSSAQYLLVDDQYPPDSSDYAFLADTSSFILIMKQSLDNCLCQNRGTSPLPQSILSLSNAKYMYELAFFFVGNYCKELFTVTDLPMDNVSISSRGLSD